MCFHASNMRNIDRDENKGWQVFVTNSTVAEVDYDTVYKIAERAFNSPIYWSNVACRYWMYDFNVWDCWCEVTHIDCTNKTIDVNIYFAPGC